MGEYTLQQFDGLTVVRGGSYCIVYLKLIDVLRWIYSQGHQWLGEFVKGMGVILMWVLLLLLHI